MTKNVPKYDEVQKTKMLISLPRRGLAPCVIHHRKALVVSVMLIFKFRV